VTARPHPPDFVYTLALVIFIAVMLVALGVRG
jgi:hypothetical protein